MFEQVKQAAVEEGKFPRDLVLGEAQIYFSGRSQAVIENYRSILVYTDELVKIQAKNMRLEFYGKRLCIDYYNQDQMKITGQIQEVKFCM